MAEFWRAIAAHPMFSGGIALMLAGSVVALLRKLPSSLMMIAQKRLVLSIEIHERDDSFAWVEKWLSVNGGSSASRSLIAKTEWVHNIIAKLGRPTAQKKFVLSPAVGYHVLRFNGVRFLMNRTRKDVQVHGTTVPQDAFLFRFLRGSRELADSFLEDVRVTGSDNLKLAGIQVLAPRSDYWMECSRQPVRPLGSVVLPGRVMEDLLQDIRSFYDSGQWYADRGIPHRRGYLLHGPPGTGKSTTVAAVAGQLGLNVNILTLSSGSLNDASLTTLINAVPPSSILLIEDVDCVFKEKRVTVVESGVTLSGLLNSLDGVCAREGRVVFLTTNHLDKLDPALIRPGRVDRKIELGYATADQLRRLFVWFFRDAGLSDEELQLNAKRFAQWMPKDSSMATAQEVLLQNRHCPTGIAASPQTIGAK